MYIDVSDAMFCFLFVGANGLKFYIYLIFNVLQNKFALILYNSMFLLRNLNDKKYATILFVLRKLLIINFFSSFRIPIYNIYVLLEHKNNIIHDKKKIRKLIKSSNKSFLI